MHCIIGSGPAGVSCAKALLKRGAQVLMLDAGIELEPERKKIVRELAAMNFSEWPRKKISALKNPMLTASASKKNSPKLVFGSDYPYRDAEEHLPRRENGVRVRPSLALGGFSAVWGAAMLPFRDGDIENWPVKSAQLAPHYRAAAEISGISGRHDDLEELFPLYSENPGELRISRPANLFLQNLERHRASLRERGWHFGHARVAVRAGDSPRGPGCVYCRMCLYGCPYGCIYNSADTVAEMRAEKNFNYRHNVIVTKLREQNEKVFIEAYDRETHAPLSFEAARVFLAAGIVPTTQILLRSQNAYDRPLRACDSQYFIFPLLMARRGKNLQSEAAYTLSQLFIELNNLKVSRRATHLQIYSHNDIIAQTVRKSLGPLKFFSRPIEERILIVQGYLHSDESPGIEMTLKRKGEKDFLQLNAIEKSETRQIVKKILREFARNTWKLGAIPLPPMLQLMPPGAGFHSGGSFPMRVQPQEFESDTLGRPHGWKNVHAVDASIFPSVPTTTITFPVMANAHRIGWEAADL